MAIPDFDDRALFPPFSDLPADLPQDGVAPAPGHWLLAQIKDNMTITKPTLVLADRDGHPFALVFDGLDRDGLDLGRLGLKKGATAVVRSARQCVPISNSEGDTPESLTSKAARRPFVRIAPGQAHTVQAVPGGLEQTLAAAAALRSRRAGTCDACGEGGEGGEASEARRLLKCTGCAQAQYCNRTCQTAGWSAGHKGECKAWRALTTIWGHAESK